MKKKNLYTNGFAFPDDPMLVNYKTKKNKCVTGLSTKLSTKNIDRMPSQSEFKRSGSWSYMQPSSTAKSDASVIKRIETHHYVSKAMLLQQNPAWCKELLNLYQPGLRHQNQRNYTLPLSEFKKRKGFL
ncbi:hypothetical protein PoB_004964100 [Plakobranchus ocellatus]|uniref:Uncharacterized protein n=1 Tax=Plakobranchus ocellatus TaxID=259542 RepID=A0AAV4BRM8_9GAST|nr:hypothetical protein PoB_004964100 [Plakobranchus ocellatus]